MQLYSRTSSTDDLERQPNMKNFTEAKRLFFSYACNHFYMSRDGVEKKYKEFSVPRNMEIEWKNEYIKHHLSNLNGNNLEALSSLQNCHAHEALPDIITCSLEGESFEMLWFAITLFHMSDGQKSEIHKKAKTKAIEICKHLINNPIFITPQCKKQINKSSLNALKAKTHVEYVLNYANNLIKQYKA